MGITDKILSIIIPTYNMERYLGYCLDSMLIKENFEALEVLVINDGSKDSSSAIAHEYAERYPTVFQVIDKENGNYGSCINRGLKEAKGKYVKVLDADDSFDTAHFEEFVAYLLNIDADLILSDFAIVNEERVVTKYHRYEFEKGREFMMDDVCTTSSFIDMEMHAVTYRRQLIIDLGYQQTEGISYTDQQWIFIPMLKVRRVYAFNKHVYKYLIGREGQTVSADVRQKSIEHMMRCIYGMIDVYNKHRHDQSEVIRGYLHARLKPLIKSVYITLFLSYSQENKKILIAFDQRIKDKNKSIYRLVEETNSHFNYIKYWREHTSTSILLVSCISRLYLKLANV